MSYQVENQESYDKGFAYGTEYMGNGGQCNKSVFGGINFSYQNEHGSRNYLTCCISVLGKTGQDMIRGVYDSGCTIVNNRIYDITEFKSQFVSTSFRKG